MAEGASAKYAYFLFETNSDVMWAEEVAGESGVPVEVVPAPRGAKDKCGMAIRTLPDHGEAFAAVLAEEGISFRRFP